MFPAQATTHVIKLFPWQLRLWMRGKQVPTNKHLTSLSLSVSFFLQCVSNRLWAAKLQLYPFFQFSFVLACSSGMPQVGGVWMFFWKAQLDSANQTSCINTGKLFHWIVELKVHWHCTWSSSVAVCDVRSMCDVCESLEMSGRQGGGGGEVREMLQSIKWQMCVCGAFLQGRKRGGGNAH